MRWHVVDRVLNDAPEVSSVVEVGCGQGSVSYRLASRYEYRGYEPDADSFAIADQRLRGLPSVELLRAAIPHEPDREFDALVAFEVLEHIEDDVEALALWAGWVRPGGLMLLSVPCNPDRFGPWDAAVGHFRRYSRSSLRETMQAAGLSDIAILATGFPLGYLTEAVRNMCAPSSSGDASADTCASGRRLQPTGRWWPLVEKSVRPFLFIQDRMSESHRGTGLLAVARKV